MDIKDQFQKILEWMQQIGKDVVGVKKDIVVLRKEQEEFREGLEELREGVKEGLNQVNLRLDTHSEALQTILKAIRGVRVEQYHDREEIKKLKLDIRSLKH